MMISSLLDTFYGGGGAVVGGFVVSGIVTCVLLFLMEKLLYKERSK